MIFHIDLDAFFATVEINKRPKLTKQPVIVCGKSKRSVVSSANYIARKFEIKSGMPVNQAKKKCKNLKIIYLDNTSYNEYKKISYELFSYIKRKYFANVEMFSIDECFANTMYSLIKIDHETKIAKKIQIDIKKRFNIEISIGIGENKFLAKMATDINKPFGITLINKTNFKKILWPIDIGKMFMIGEKTANKLRQININTIGDLANFQDHKTLKKILKTNTYDYINNANAIVEEEYDYFNDNKNLNTQKSFSINETYEEDIYNDDEIITKLKELVSYNIERMNQNKTKCKNIGIIIKYFNFKINTFSSELNFYTNNKNIINNKVVELYGRHKINLPIRMLGVSFKNLLSADSDSEKTLFGETKKNKNSNENVHKIIERIKKDISDISISAAEDILKNK